MNGHDSYLICWRSHKKYSATSHSNNAGALDFGVSVRFVSYARCHNSSIALPRYIAKLKAVTLKQAHIAQAYTEASTDFFASPRLKSHHCKVLQLYSLTCSLSYLPLVDETLVTSPLYFSLTISVNTLGRKLARNALRCTVWHYICS